MNTESTEKINAVRAYKSKRVEEGKSERKERQRR
jgi:hypothetical protein